MKLVLKTSIVVATLLASVEAAADNGAAFDAMKKWLVSEGAQVNTALKGDLTQHGGANIRGVVTTSALTGDYKTTLFEVPKRLWLLLGNFPTFSQAVLPSTNECNDLADWEAYRIKLAAAIVTESKKGTNSLHYAHIHGLPTMEEFHSFLPRLMEAPLQQDFAALPLVDTAKEQQSYDQNYNRVCFEQWKKAPACPAAAVTWDEMELALTWIRTRCYGTSEGTAIVPGTDMLNAAKASDLNTYWSSTKEAFSLHTKINDVAAGQELYESYCQDCDNNAMLRIWGVYMEDNPNPVDSSKVACSAQAQGPLRKAMEAVLEPKGASKKWTSPRCKASVFSTPQGPTRCSLARLTWEYCAVSWGLAAASPQTSFLSRGASPSLTPREDAMLVFQSAIGDVPKALRRGRAKKVSTGALQDDM